MLRHLTLFVIVGLLVTVGSGAAVVPDQTAPPEWSRFVSPLGQQMLAEPAAAAGLGEAQGEDFLETGLSASHVTREALDAFVDVDVLLVDLPAADALWVELADAWAAEGEPLTQTETAALRSEAATLDPLVAQAVAELVNGETHARMLSDGAFQDIDLAALVAVLGHTDPQPYEAGGLDAALTLLPSKAFDLSLMAETEALLSSLDMAALAAANLAMADALDRAVALLADVSDEAPDGVTVTTSAPGDLFQAATPYGDIVVSGTDAHTYTDEYFVSIDLGGDDTYNNPTGAVQADLLDSGVGAGTHTVDEVLYATGNAPGVPPTDAFDQDWRDTFLRLVHQTHNASVAVDLSGDDLYDYSYGAAQGSGGFGGFGALVDLSGADLYEAHAHAQGDGLVAGVGILMDLDGDDSYDADRQAQGFGQVGGLGILVDGAGADTYGSRVIAQGLGWDLGVGVLVDHTGPDAYTCWGIDDFSDSIIPVTGGRPGSTCQATGWGGSGVLVDGGGDDEYFTEGGFQTMALLGTSLLVDRSGIDTHTAGEWSLGVGAVGVAVLADGGGDDRYDTRMVNENPWVDTYIGGNGEGYVGVGVLADAAGDDVYTTDVRKDLWRVQYACGNGCAHDGGVGILIEGGGDDDYTSEVGQGGTSGGVAVLFDASGNDDYSLRHGSTRGQGQAAFDPILGPGITGSVMSCIYGILVDGDGTDSYSNTVVDFGQRTDDDHWGQGQFGRGMDGTDGTTAYLTSSEFRDDLGTLLATAGCNTVTN